MKDGKKTGQGKLRGLLRWAPVLLLAAAAAALCLLLFPAQENGTAGAQNSAPVSASAQPSPSDALTSQPDAQTGSSSTVSGGTQEYTVDSVPAYAGEPWVALGDNVPDFSPEELTATPFESYSELDELGRCGAAFACVGTETMPTEAREDIWMVKPTGWQSVKYDFVDGESLYNRCHLIGFQLTGENANEKNLVTGTRYMNVSGMLPFEDEVAAYVKETGGHVLYRVTPIYEGDNLVASGVRMEGWSVEDEGQSVCFDVFCYNCQPGVTINYGDGSNRINEEDPVFNGEVQDYVLNTGSRKFHLPECSGAPAADSKNRKAYTGTREMLVVQGYTPCGQCKP